MFGTIGYCAIKIGEEQRFTRVPKSRKKYQSRLQVLFWIRVLPAFPHAVPITWYDFALPGSALRNKFCPVPYPFCSMRINRYIRFAMPHALYTLRF